MKKEETDKLFDILDATMEAVNAINKKEGTGKSFSYNMKPRIIGEGKDANTVYDMTLSIREMGHGERDLQTISFLKPKDVDRYTMEAQMIMQTFVAFANTSLFHWDELGKMLNTDQELQKAAKDLK